MCVEIALFLDGWKCIGIIIICIFICMVGSECIFWLLESISLHLASDTFTMKDTGTEGYSAEQETWNFPLYLREQSIVPVKILLTATHWDDEKIGTYGTVLSHTTKHQFFKPYEDDNYELIMGWGIWTELSLQHRSAVSTSVPDLSGFLWPFS